MWFGDRQCACGAIFYGPLYYLVNWLSDERLAAMLAALERSAAPCVVRCTGIAERVPDPRIEDWLLGRFTRDGSFGACTVWERGS